ncbi:MULTISPECIES: hypothetical protein [unclassified Leeuwenhoekiella]|uniref:hypothetical protein n=1 Tax=unclassified Leeuwenhoekiella TaxID=2615029 RepID=UPI000C6495F4|nr:MULTISPECIES: hypothetical protein [unclassified Leeuwenhoekiella]MAW94217.1 hypothetical protein [Leeuwenhoekiella sp.]MAW96869.1 hypothetical protein [Leeuwenhoekiella sp.]|tara:strand:+ start:4525 stop:5250 length:726 start_codon:yes stop_codon:yes gene_type:complete
MVYTFRFTVFIFILLFWCNLPVIGQENSVFDKILGADQSKTLDTLVTDFENNFLKKNYPDLKTTDAYRQFLMDLRGQKEFAFGISKEARKRFAASKLRNEIYEYPDSVWVLPNSTYDKIESDSITILRNDYPYIKTRYKYEGADGSYEYTYSRGVRIELMNESKYDSIIAAKLKQPEFNTIGSYIQALEAIEDSSAFLTEFYKIKKSSGILHPYMAGAFVTQGADLDNEVIRKIIVLEFVY